MAKEGGDTVHWMIDVIYLTDQLVRWLTYVFIDDSGLLELLEVPEEHLTQEMVKEALRARSHLAANGLNVHKETAAEGLESALGITIPGARP